MGDRRAGSILGIARRRARAGLDGGSDWAVLEILPDAAIAVDRTGIVVGANGLALSLLGPQRGTVIGSSVVDMLLDQGHPGGDAFRRIKELDPGEIREARRAGGDSVVVELTSKVVKTTEGSFAIVTLRDATRRVRDEVLDQAQLAALEMITRGLPLADVLASVAAGIDRAARGSLASIMLATAEGDLDVVASPGLPASFVAALGRVPVASKAGPGVAAQRRRIVAADIASEAGWDRWRDAALRHGLRGCWSAPIAAADGAMLGVLALYRIEPGAPEPRDVELVERATAIVADVIERHRAEERTHANERRYQRLSELTSDFAYAFSFEDGLPRVEWVTEAFSRITGYEQEEWEDRGAWRGLVHPDDMLAFEQRLPRLLRGEEVMSEVRIVTKSGDVRWLSVYSRPVWNAAHDEVIGIEGAAQDFTSRKEAEDAKTMFLATASHELKTPLTVIRGFAQLMGDQRHAAGDVEREAAATIERRAKELDRILERILLSSRIETGRADVTVAETQIGGILSERAAALRMASGRDVVLLLETLPPVLADPDVVATVLDHLLDNAVKYSPDGGRIVVEAVADAAAVRVRVTDHGIGMTAEQTARCFEKFWQADSTDARRFGGTGIGLFIVRSLVEAMGGAVGVESAPGAGSTFWFRLRTPRTDNVGSSETGRGQRTSILEFMRQLGVPEGGDD